MNSSLLIIDIGLKLLSSSIIMSNYSKQYRESLHKKLLLFASDAANTETIYTILKEHNEQLEISKDIISFDVSLLKDKTITTLNKFLMM
jgi:hypothetical protein